MNIRFGVKAPCVPIVNLEEHYAIPDPQLFNGEMTVESGDTLVVEPAQGAEYVAVRHQVRNLRTSETIAAIAHKQPDGKSHQVITGADLQEMLQQPIWRTVQSMLKGYREHEG